MRKKDFEAIGRQLLPDLPGFAVKGYLLLLRPLDHTLRGICFNGSIDPRSFYVEVFIQPLFVPSRHISLNIGWWLRRVSGRSDSWGADDPNLVEELCMELKREALPFLSRIQTPRDVADAAGVVHPTKGPGLHQPIARASGDPITQQAIAFALARADEIEKGREALAPLIRTLHDKIPWRREMAERALSLQGMLLNDPAAARRQLDAWEAETVKSLGLEQFR